MPPYVLGLGPSPRPLPGLWVQLEVKWSRIRWSTFVKLLHRVGTRPHYNDVQHLGMSTNHFQAPRRPKTRRAAIYLRISLDQTGEGLAVDRQRDACQAIITARGWERVDEYVDNSISATDSKRVRPGYDALMEGLDAGRFDAVVCYDLDRLTRQPRQLEDWIDRAETGALALVTANGEADLTTDAGRLFARIKLAVARSEVERKSARQRDAARQRSEIGRPPLGVRLTGYTSAGELVPHEAETIRRMFADFHAGLPLRAIARSLEAEGIKTRHGREWNPSSVRSTLVNPRYAGRAIYQGVETGQRGAWEPLVDDAMFEAVQAGLKDPNRRTQTSTARKHLGSGLYLCGVCDRPVSAWTGGRYRCRDGAHVNRSQKPVDDYVTEVINARLGQPDLADLLVSSQADTSECLAEIDNQKRRLRRAEDDYLAEVIDGPLYMRTRDEAAAALRDAERLLAAATGSSAASETIGAPDPVEAFKTADLATRRAVVNFFLIVRLHRGRRGCKTFDPATVDVTWK